ncbi:COG4315 family predicted lipoprotein [Dyadobacter sp.]|uniref:COG4315 family predicted lipoprotein n=1 Tax=Dyadobacter sp. TaxID=1914288 RepID=UPI003F6FA526
MKILSITRMLFLLGALLAVTVSCSDDDGEEAPVTPNDIMLKENGSLGKVLTDKNGKTLYFFTKDAGNTSVCTGPCLAAWPVFSVANPASLKLDAGLKASDFANITRTDGATQTTYKGWPLYYFANDAAPGEVKGEGVNNAWYVAKAKYTVMLSNAQLVGNDGKSYKADYTEGTGETQFLVDSLGRTLYAFARDSSMNNNWTTNDATHDATWPIYEVASIDDIPSALDKTQFGTITVFGKKQLTYKGWPLYYFGADAMTKGMTKGVSVPRPGVWPIVNKESPVAPK